MKPENLKVKLLISGENLDSQKNTWTLMFDFLKLFDPYSILVLNDGNFVNLNELQPEEVLEVDFFWDIDKEIL